MLEILQFTLSGGLFHFLGAIVVICLPILCIGWALNAFVVGFKGEKVDNPFNDQF